MTIKAVFRDSLLRIIVRNIYFVNASLKNSIMG